MAEIIESYQKKAAPIDSVKHHLGRRYHSFWDKDGSIGLHQERGVKNQDVFADWKSVHFTCEHLEKYLEEHDLVAVMMYTEYNHPEKNFKCYGHPCMLQHNWVTIQVGDCVMLAQCMLFFGLPEGKVIIDSPIYMADQGGAHVLVHFIQYDIYNQPPVGLKLYGIAQKDFCQDEDSFLIRGWSKHTAVINKLMITPGTNFVHDSGFMHFGSNYWHS